MSAVAPPLPSSIPSPLRPLLKRVSADVRLRRAETGAWRGAFWGSTAAVAVLAGKGALNDAALPAAVAVFLAGLVGGALHGACRRVDPLTAARLADRRLDLADRLSSTLELSATQPRNAVGQSLIEDTLERVQRLGDARGSRFVARVWPREARLLAVPLGLALLLAYAPALPGPGEWLQQWQADRAQEENRATVSLLDKLKLLGGSLLKKDPFTAQDQQQSKAGDTKAAPESAEFKDKAIAKPRSDFDSFVKKGDERLRMLERTDRLPDLQSDFASSKYRMLLKQSQELSSGKGPGQLSANRLAQILKEMERLGKKGGDWSDDVNQGMDALEQGQMEEAMESMEKALGKIREAEDRQRASKSLRGGKDAAGPERDAAGSADGSNLAFNDPDRRGGYSNAKGGASKGAPTARLRSTPYDSGIQGQRGGRAPSFETQSTGRPGASGSQLQYLGEVGQYRRLMEDAISREQVPRDYHNQIRDYFKSLGDQ